MKADRSIARRKNVAVAAFAGLLVMVPVLAQGADLPTKTGSEIGIGLSSYKYNEPGVASFKANKIGFDYAYTRALDAEWPNQSKGWFLRGDVHFTTGKGDYSSPLSGNLNNRPDWYYEVRGVIGKDFHLGDSTVSPYVGLGYRYLFNDFRGVTSTGATGYRRESNYFSIPVGVNHKMRLANQSLLVSTVEFDYFIRGRQESKLSDASPFFRDVTNRQRNGYGFRLGTMVHFSAWSVGPSLVVWRIKDSDRVGPALTFEPRNSTVELGVKAAYTF